MIERKRLRLSAHATLNWFALGAVLIAFSAMQILPTKLVWNTSPSVPTGLYWINYSKPRRGNLVLVRLPKAAAKLAAERGYLPSEIPAIKRVMALQGDIVCRFERVVSINGKAVATALLGDGFGRELPAWQGCHLLESRDVFLLADHRQSFDGRYFGVIRMSGIVGVAHPVFLLGNGSGR